MRPGIWFLLLVLGIAPVAATTVVPPSFPELVASADHIYRGRVTAIESRVVADAGAGGSVIKTFVTFAVERVLKGTEQSTITLEFLGGTVGTESLTVSGMPTFTVGGREIVFVQKNGVQFCPLVALMHGRYRVQRDESAARDVVARDDGMPLTDLAEVAAPMVTLPEPMRAASAAAARTRALSRDAFEASIRAEVQRVALPLRAP